MSKAEHDQLKALAAHWLAHARSQGLISEREAARMSGALGGAVGPAPPTTFFPSWCDGFALQLATASDHRTEQSVDFSRWSLGRFVLSLELRHTARGSYLELDWKATEPNPQSWWIAFFLQGEQDAPPICDKELGGGTEGHEIMTTTELGFDPYESPFQYMIYSKEPPHTTS